jgi:hypothetical protein
MKGKEERRAQEMRKFKRSNTSIVLHKIVEKGEE